MTNVNLKHYAYMKRVNTFLVGTIMDIATSIEEHPDEDCYVIKLPGDLVRALLQLPPPQETEE